MDVKRAVLFISTIHTHDTIVPFYFYPFRKVRLLCVCVPNQVEDLLDTPCFFFFSFNSFK